MYNKRDKEKNKGQGRMEGDQVDQRGKDYLLIDRKKYIQVMAQNLPVLRAKLSISQTELAEMIGVTRQTISAAESGARELSWTNFVSLLYIFTLNEETVPLLKTLGIYTPELASLFQVAGLNKLKKKDEASENQK